MSAFRDDIRTCAYRTSLNATAIGLDETIIKVLTDCIHEKTYNSLYVKQLASNDNENITRQVETLNEKMRIEGGNLVNDFFKKRSELISNKMKESYSDESKRDPIEAKRNAISEKLKNRLLMSDLTNEYTNKIHQLFYNEVDKIEL